MLAGSWQEHVPMLAWSEGCRPTVGNRKCTRGNSCLGIHCTRCNVSPVQDAMHRHLSVPVSPYLCMAMNRDTAVILHIVGM